MKYYELTIDKDKIITANGIYAESSNIDNLETNQKKAGQFNTIILSSDIETWPEVEFYYSSLAGHVKTAFLMNVDRWPIVHKDVIDLLNFKSIQGFKYYPVRLIDVATATTNDDYALLFVDDWIAAIDMLKSQFKYN